MVATATKNWFGKMLDLQREMSGELRVAVIADRAAVEALVDVAYAPYVPRIGRKPGPMLDDYGGLILQGHVHVIATAGALQGLVVLLPLPDAMLLDNIAVAPSAQRTGVGRRLLQFAEQAARNAGFRLIRLYTHEKMTENIALYSRAGYVETHRVEEKGLRRVYMAKGL